MHRLKGTWGHDLLGVWAVLWSYGPIIAALAVFARWPSVGTFALAFVTTTFRQNAIFVVAHECFHGTLFRNRRVNELVGAYVAASPILMPYAQSRRIHLDHHRRVGREDDPSRYAWDWPRPRRGHWLLYLAAMSTGVPFVVRALRSLRGRGTTAVEQTTERRGLETGENMKRDFIRVIVSHAAIFGLFTLTIGPLWYFALWLAPALGPHLVIDDMRQFLEHRDGGLVIYRAGPIERFLWGPFNFHLHAFHHAIASEPWFCVPSIEARARAKEPNIRTLPSYTLEIVRYLRGAGAPALTASVAEAPADSTSAPSSR